MSAQVLGVLHIAELLRDPRLRIPSHRDWAKIPPILKGEWPQPIPPRFLVTEQTIGRFEEWADNAGHAPSVVIDAE